VGEYPAQSSRPGRNTRGPHDFAGILPRRLGRRAGFVPRCGVRFLHDPPVLGKLPDRRPVSDVTDLAAAVHGLHGNPHLWGNEGDRVGPPRRPPPDGFWLKKYYSVPDGSQIDQRTVRTIRNPYAFHAVPEVFGFLWVGVSPLAAYLYDAPRRALIGSPGIGSDLPGMR
jgi:hypothetical protein